MDTTLSSFARKQVAPPQAPVQVLHIIKSLGRGGAEVLLPESLNQHNRQRYHFHYIYFLPWKNQVVPEIVAAGGTVVCMPARNNVQIMLQVRKIVQYIRRHHIQLIHCHLPWAGIVGRIAGKLSGVPVVYTEHNKWERYHRLTYLMNKWSFAAQQQVIAVSGEVANSIKTHYKRAKPAVQVVQNGIDTDKYASHHAGARDIRRELDISPKATVIGIACVFRAQKRLTHWLGIAHALHQQHPDTRFIIVGDGVLHNEVHQKARDLNMEGYLHFAGLQTEMRPWLQAMDIFMMSSEFEGLPIALLEAMSMGCMPACTAAGGIPEVIKDGENGILVPVNDPQQLAVRLSAFLLQRDQLAARQQAARDTVVNHFSMQKMVGQLEKIYEQLIPQNKAL